MQYTAVTLERRNGLDGFQLKLIALVIMTIDHIYYFGCSLTDMPEIMTLIGRIAAPIFVFFVTEGFVHTHSRGRYLLRLYIGGVLMQIGNLFVNICFPMQNGVIVLNGIFTTMAVIVIYLWWIENMRRAWCEHRRGCAVLYALQWRRCCSRSCRCRCCCRSRRWRCSLRRFLCPARSGARAAC